MKNWHFILIVAMLFAHIETQFFGGNFMPQTAMEMLCDGVACSLLALAFLTRSVENKPTAGPRV